ncbi:transglycosylase domain-containing protein [Amycolatopsis sp. H20-H5]|nr:transglycosylase domain-containing protein [Amycolatopsis sp. H20-H5]MEC3973689.1 transglycosylase domain-containing protein [Amycolatopsis sp. H20-H5]
MSRGRKRWWRVRRIAYRFFGLAIGVPLAAFAVGYFVLDVRSPQDVLAELDKTVMLQYADGSELTKVLPPGGDRLFVPYAAVPEKLRNAIVAVEDPTFWDNQGFDPTGIGRAALTGVGGGSGITQQYIKKSTGDDDATITRKFSELVLATKITQQQSKEQIFEGYVNVISFGRSTFGPASAMNAYFGKPLDNSMTWSEAAFLAGMIQSPSVHDPAASGNEHAAKRWKYVVDKLVERHYVTPAEAATMSYPEAEVQAPSETRAGKVTYSEYHIKQQVLAELEQLGFPLDRLRRGALKIETTIDRRTQESAAKTVKDRLTGEPEQFRASLVAVEPGTGAVRAYEGGNASVHDYAGTEVPTGSAFYPFTVAAALRAGIGVDQAFRSPEKIQFLGETFRYQNRCSSAEHCTLREALAKSADAPFVDLTRKLGPDAVSKAARDAGIPETVEGAPTLREQDGFLIGAGIAVGRYPLRPSDIAGAYATFANDGMRVTPHLVSKIRDEKGDVIWAHTSAPVPAFDDQDTSRRISGNVTGALQQHLSDGRPVALMEGEFRYAETSDNASGWAVGYTPQLATAVWVGSDNPGRMRDAHDAQLTGKTVPADIWRTFMDGYHHDLPVRGFPPERPIGTAPRR